MGTAAYLLLIAGGTLLVMGAILPHRGVWRDERTSDEEHLQIAQRMTAAYGRWGSRMRRLGGLLLVMSFLALVIKLLVA